MDATGLPPLAGQEQEVTRSMGVVDAFSVEELRQETERLDKLTGYNKDYCGLRALLEDLPTKLSHTVMVPFGRHAFFPGRLIHSNELMVHLGDKYYVQRSCKQTVDIIKRREEFLEKSIAATRSRIQSLRDMVAMTERTGLRGAQPEEEGLEPVEIMEEYNSDDERRDSARAAEEAELTVSPPPPQPRPGKGSVEEEDAYRKMMARLQDLEMAEERAGPHCGENDGEDEGDDSSSSSSSSLSSSKGDSARMDVDRGSEISSNSSGSEGEGSEEDGERGTAQGAGRGGGAVQAGAGRLPSGSGGGIAIKSPADILAFERRKRLQAAGQTKPEPTPSAAQASPVSSVAERAIPAAAKSDSSMQATAATLAAPAPGPSSAAVRPPLQVPGMGFTGTIIEHVSTQPSPALRAPAPTEAAPSAQARPKSLFKTMRQQNS